MLRFFTPEHIEDPYTSYRKWRDHFPIWREPTTGFWVLSRHSDVKSVLTDYETFSQGGDAEPSLPLLGDDPPRHTHLRNLVSQAFNRNTILSLKEQIAEIAEELVDSIARGHEFDVVEILTAPLPTIVISRLLGIPEHKKQDFKLWADSHMGVVSDQDLLERARIAMVMREYFAELKEERRTNPNGDLISLLVSAEIDGRPLSDKDVISFITLLLVAGNETTTNLMGNLLNIVVDQPHIWKQLQENPGLVEAVVEETLRYDSPVQYVIRRAARDAHFYGERVAAGESLIVVIGAANRDPQLFADPDRFNMSRRMMQHYAFGHGIHYCLGALLARLEATIAIQALLSRVSVIERGSSPSARVSSYMLRGFQSLPLMAG